STAVENVEKENPPRRHYVPEALPRLEDDVVSHPYPSAFSHTVDRLADLLVGFRAKCEGDPLARTAGLTAAAPSAAPSRSASVRGTAPASLGSSTAAPAAGPSRSDGRCAADRGAPRLLGLGAPASWPELELPGGSEGRPRLGPQRTLQSAAASDLHRVAARFPGDGRDPRGGARVPRLRPVADQFRDQESRRGSPDEGDLSGIRGIPARDRGPHTLRILRTTFSPGSR